MCRSPPLEKWQAGVRIQGRPCAGPPCPAAPAPASSWFVPHLKEGGDQIKPDCGAGLASTKEGASIALTPFANINLLSNTEINAKLFAVF